jgi:hypothetical protein
MLCFVLVSTKEAKTGKHEMPMGLIDLDFSIRLLTFPFLRHYPLQLSGRLWRSSPFKSRGCLRTSRRRFLW